MDLLATIAYECSGCTKPISLAGPDQLLIGLSWAAAAMVPVAILHRALRRYRR